MEDFFGFPLIVVPFLILFLIFIEYIYYADGKNKKKIIRDAIKKEEYTLTSFNEENIVHEVYNGEKKTFEGRYEYCDLVYREYDTYVALINKDINTGIFVYKENGVMDFLKNKNIMQIDEYKKKNKRKNKKSSV